MHRPSRVLPMAITTALALALAGPASTIPAAGRKLKVTVAVAARDAAGTKATTGAKVTVRAATG
jgi:hypothetical protein